MKKQKARKAKGGTRAKSGAGYKWLAGGLVGAVLGVSAVLFAESKLGKKLGDRTRHLSADFYRFMAPQIKKVKKMGEEEYKKFVAEAMERYSKDKKLSRAEARHLMSDALAAWKHLKRNL